MTDWIALTIHVPGMGTDGGWVTGSISSDSIVSFIPYRYEGAVTRVKTIDGSTLYVKETYEQIHNLLEIR